MAEQRAGGPRGLDDCQLMARVVGQDESAFEELQARYGPMVRAVGARFLDPDDREIHESDTWVRLWLWSRSFRCPADRSAGGYIYRIAVRAAFDIRRQNGRWLRALDAVLLHTPGASGGSADWETSPGDALLSEQRRLDVRHCVEKLGPPQREALQLWMQDLSHEEIARRANAGKDAVNMRIFHAKAAVRRCLEAVWRQSG